MMESFKELEAELKRVVGYPQFIINRFELEVNVFKAPSSTSFRDVYYCTIYYMFEKQDTKIKLKITSPFKDNIHLIAMNNIPNIKHAMKYNLQNDTYIVNEYPELVV